MQGAPLSNMPRMPTTIGPPQRHSPLLDTSSSAPTPAGSCPRRLAEWSSVIECGSLLLPRVAVVPRWAGGLTARHFTTRSSTALHGLVQANDDY